MFRRTESPISKAVSNLRAAAREAAMAHPGALTPDLRRRLELLDERDERDDDTEIQRMLALNERH